MLSPNFRQELDEMSLGTNKLKKEFIQFGYKKKLD